MNRFLCILVLTVAVWIVPSTPASAEAGTLLGADFRPDTPFPEFAPLWREGWGLRDEKGDLIRYATANMPLGGYLHAFISNPGTSGLKIEDVSLQGISLVRAIAPDGPGKNRDNRFASSIAFGNLSVDEMNTMIAAGEPVWWKADPFEIPPQGSAEIVIRLRRVPQVEKIAISVSTDKAAPIVGHIDIKAKSPQIVSIGFSPACDRAYLYLKHPDRNAVPKSVRIDGHDVSGGTRIASDPSQTITPAVVKLDQPIKQGAFHLFEVGYQDGSSARSSIRVDWPDFVYGMWGGFAFEEECKDLNADGARYIEDLRSHNINTIMSQFGGNVRAYVRSETGQAMCAKHDIRIMDHNPGMFPNQRYVFLHDEPDAKDIKAERLPLDKRLGTRGQWLVGLGREFRSKVPDQLQVLNIDNTFKPENWYMYAQLPDLPCADPYYQEQMHSVYKVDPGSLPAYVKPTYVYAAGAIYQSACAPKPMHLILHTCRFEEGDDVFRAPTPEEKRVELYYSLAAGARGISFWWYTPTGRFKGLGNDASDLRTLFAEIGLVGGEFRTAEPVLARACPTPMDLRTSPMLWARALLAGSDSLVLVIANDNIASDRWGTTIRPLLNARVSLRPPAWLKVQDAFEVSPTGILDVDTQTHDGSLTVNLGRVNVTRLVVVTSDPQLRTQLEHRFDNRFAENARRLLAEAGPRDLPASLKKTD